MKNYIQYNQKLNYNQKKIYNNYSTLYSIKFIYVEDSEKVNFKDNSFSKFITDYLIGKFDNAYNAYDWFYPFNMKVDWNNSDFQVMPQSESDYIEMPDVDGDIPENTTYKNRAFNVVLYSDQGLSVTQKEELKSSIAKILDGTKNKYKRLTLQPKETYFDVKYSGQASVSEGPSFVKATIPFDVKPYGHPFFTQTVTGTGKVTNNGLKPAGPIIKISGSVNNPSFSVGDQSYTWNGTVPAGSLLIVNFDSELCYLQNSSGVKENAITKLSSIDFKKIQPGETCNISSSIGNNFTASIVESILW